MHSITVQHASLTANDISSIVTTFLFSQMRVEARRGVAGVTRKPAT